MEKKWFECKVKYQKMLDTGERKTVTELYLVYADSVSDAEQRIIEEMSSFSEGELTVKAVKEASYKEVFQHDEEKFYLCKVAFVTLDEDSGTEKKKASTILVQASDFDTAGKYLKAGMKGTLSDYDILSIAETAILDLFI